jgi:aryl-alcohol dehydrogenase
MSCNEVEMLCDSVMNNNGILPWQSDGKDESVKIRAAVTESKSAPFVVQELELGDLRPDEVLVEVAAAGICHTDLICRDQWLPVPLPAVLGHEGAGVVIAIGSAVT